ncbi:putative membrane protein YdjX (TVP38/TMEM64 family) [Inhella inkyongensis]|uniref:TVP38/TMEM64 family membrane protein n=1 Tax=Inhella inkyongensis TaxID=392593 RepID=A0A840S4U8_9BURK|nr:VTT domain-containing protein [Inhella inkyongensis]MBB5204056.1 putative membrane protein YdjX (TVP38/TMEM64 family) [Inhella inkyongensis]
MTPSPRRKLILLAVLALALIALALVWQFSPAAQWLSPLKAVEQVQQLLHAMGWPWLLAAFVLGGCLALPLSLLCLLAVLALGPLPGIAFCLSGGSLIALPSFALGRALGRQAVEQLAGPKVQALNALVGRRGLLAVIAVRLVPAAPFAVVNLALGATLVGWRDFLLGNVIGMLPMVLTTAWLAPQILQQLQNPSGLGWAGLAGVIALVAGATWALKRWARQL